MHWGNQVASGDMGESGGIYRRRGWGEIASGGGWRGQAVSARGMGAGSIHGSNQGAGRVHGGLGRSRRVWQDQKGRQGPQGGFWGTRGFPANLP